MRERMLFACALGLAACAPITTTKRTIETPRTGGLVRDAPKHGKTAFVGTPSETGIVLASTDELTCIERRVTNVHSVEETTRHVNTPMTVFEYVFGIVLGGAGGFAIAAPQTVIDQTGANLQPNNVRTAGVGTAGLGVLFLTFGIINSMRGGTTQRDLGDQERRATTGDVVACGVAARANDAIVLAIGAKSWPLGTTDTEGKLTVAWATIAADVFDADWHTASVIAPAGSVLVDLTAARMLVAEREWKTLAATPSMEGAKVYHKRFPGIHDADASASLVELADRTYAPTVSDALAHGNLDVARKTLVAWKADAPGSSTRIEKEADVAALETLGPADYLYGKYEASMSGVDADPTKLDEADRMLVNLAQVAPADPRLSAAQKAVTKRRTTIGAVRLAGARGHADKAKHFARHAEWAKADAEIAEAAKLAADDRSVTAAIEYVAKYKTAAGVTTVATDPKPKDPNVNVTVDLNAKPAEDTKAKADALAAAAKAKADEARLEKARIAMEAKTRADEQRAEQARIAIEAKAKADEERIEKARVAIEAKAKADEERAKLAAEAKAKADEDRARIAEEKAKANQERARSAEEKAKAAEETRKAAAERARVAADEKARRAAETAKANEAAKVAAAAERAKAAEAARIAAEQRRRLETPRGGVVRPVPQGLVGLWASMIGNAVWLVDLRGDGSGRTAVWIDGQIVAMRAIGWRLDGDVLDVQAGASALRSRAEDQASGRMRWSGAEWRRQ